MDYSTIKKLGIILAVGSLAVWILYPFVYAFLFAGLLAIMLFPIQQKLEKHIGKGKSSFLLVMAILLCVFIPLFLIVSYAISEAIIYVKNIESLSQFFNSLEEHLSKIPYIGDYAKDQLHKFVTSVQKDKAKIASHLDTLLPTVKYVGSTGISLATNFIITLLLVYQFLVSSTALEKFFDKVVLKDFEDGNKFLKTTVNTTRRVSLAVLTTASLTGIIMGIVYFALGIPSPILFAFITALGAMIPFMVTIVYVFLSIGVFVLFGLTKAIILLVIGFTLNMITDNVISPKIINKEMKLSFVASLLGIMGGIEAFGIIGIFLGPVIFNVVFVGIQKAMSESEKI
nr:AI-2E family transporter [Pseudofrancisella aestuarii]